MIFLDWILIIIILYFTFSGFKSGFIRTVGGLLGFLVGLFLAGRYYDILAGSWKWIFFGNLALAKISLFIIIFLVVSRLFKLTVFVLDKAFDLLKFIPFTGLLNRLAGGVFGFIEGTLMTGMVIFILVRFSEWVWIIESIQRSQVAKKLLYVVNILSPFIPDALQTMKLLIK